MLFLLEEAYREGRESRDSEVSLIPHLCAKVLLVLAEPDLPYLRVLGHVCQRVGADDVARKTEFFL